MRHFVWTVTILLLLCRCEFVTADRPNFLWIMSEDNSKHYLQHFDDFGANTPNIEALAQNGVTFDRAFSCGAVCSVARTTLITGVYAPRLGTQYHRRIKLASMPKGWRMFPTYLREAGYYTTNNSKKDYNAVENKGVWDESSRKASWQNRPKGKPFFHVQTYTDSHESSLHFKKEWIDNFDNQTPPDAVKIAPFHPDTDLFRLTYARYHDRMKVIDDKVGKVIAQLKSAGVLENTFVFYFGDHGGVLPRGKGYIYETGLHVPLVVRVPEQWKALSPFPKNSRTDGFVEFVDFGPTVLTMAGVKTPDFMDGKNFFRRDIGSQHETIGYVDRMDEKYDFCRSLRVGNWKYIRNYQAIYPDGLQNNYRYEMLAYQQWRKLFQDGKLNDIQKAFFQPKVPEMLFDLSADPFEVNNLATDPASQTVLKQMRLKLADRLKSMPDLSFIPENILVDEALDQPIEFGQSRKTQISNLIDIADLAVLPFAEAAESLRIAVSSDDPLARQWGYSVCSIFGKQASPLFEQAKTSSQSDPDALVRLRAAEFLGHSNVQDPMPTILEILRTSESATLNLIVLQSLIHFKDGPFEYDTTLDTATVTALNPEVIRRLGYIDGISLAEMKKRMKTMKAK